MGKTQGSQGRMRITVDKEAIGEIVAIQVVQREEERTGTELWREYLKI